MTGFRFRIPRLHDCSLARPAGIIETIECLVIAALPGLKGLLAQNV